MTAPHARTTPQPRAAHLAQVAGKLAYRALIAFLVAANLVLGAYVVAVILPSVIRIETARGPVVPVLPSPSPSAPASVMSAVLMPADADCAACHSAPGETRARPVMAHPLDGWTNCTECHAANKLVETAPGHSGLHKEDCLVCHTARSDQDPVPKPHHSYSGTACTICHGNAAIKQAPLPTDMAGRTNCWVCHGLTEGDELWTGTATTPTPAAPAATVRPRGTLPPMESPR